MLYRNDMECDLYALKRDRMQPLAGKQNKLEFPFFSESKIEAKVMCYDNEKMLAFLDINSLEKDVIKKLVEEYGDKTFIEKRLFGLYILDNIDFDNNLLLVIPWNDILEFVNEDSISLLLNILENVKKTNHDLFQMVLEQQEECEFRDMLQEVIDENKYNFSLEELYDDSSDSD